MSHSPLPSCLKSIFSQVVLYGMLSANTYAQVTFTADTTSGCAPLAVNFTNTSSPPANYFRWDFGDGDTLWALNASHIYDSAGTFQAILQGWDTTGGGSTFIGSDTLAINVNGLSTTPVSASASLNPVCSGSSTTLSVSGGLLGTGATWNWYSVSCGGTPAGTGSSISVSPIGTTTYYVRAEGTCNTTACVSVTVTVNYNSTAPTSVSASSNPLCPGNSTTLSVNGGSLGSGANWQWYSGACGGTYVGTGSVISANPASTTTYYVRAEGTCNTSACAGVTVTVVTGISVTITKSNATCFGICNGTATPNVTGGSPPYTYFWSNGATVATNTGLCAGTYTVTVNDAIGCTGTSSVTITQPNALLISITKTDATCSGACNGNASAFISGGTLPYTYQWSNSSTTTSINNLCTGVYTISVTDSKGCQSTFSVTINETSPALTISKNDDVCNAVCDGNAAATTSAGLPPYTYQWSDGSTSTSISNLCAGGYSVTVTDAYGCTATSGTTINSQPVLFTFGVTVNTSSCGVCDGDATVNPTNGISPYSFQWNDPLSQISQTATGLCSGMITVTVTDSAGCSGDTTVSLGNASGFILSFTSTQPLCNGDSNGTATAIPVGGVPPFTYNWNMGQTGDTATGLSSGSYSVTATDSAGCSYSANITVSQPAPLGLNVNPMANCNDTTGILTAVASGGVGNYQFSIDTGATWNVSNIFTSLPTGEYFVMVEDSNGCLASDSVTIDSSVFFITLNASITGSSGCSFGNGSMLLSATGGMPPYNFRWTSPNLGWGQNKYFLSPADYTIQVIDASGCTQNGNYVVPNICQLNFINGYVFIDVNGNCIKDSGETALSNWQVKAMPGPKFASTNANGYYQMFLDSGTFTLSLINSIPSLYTLLCPIGGTYNLNLGTQDTLTNTNFGLQSTGCPDLSVSLIHIGYRACFCNWHKIAYKNNGTAPAFNSYITLELAPGVTATTACPPPWTFWNNSPYNSTPWTYQVGNTYYYDIGTILPQQTGSIYVLIEQSCGLVLNSTLCTTVHIYPDSSCTPSNPAWDKSSVRVEGACVNDSLACFTIYNTGDPGSGDMQGTSQYRIYDNNILVFTGTFQLTGGDSVIICWPANSNTIRLEADQRPNHPGNSHPRADIELCGDPVFTLGQITLVPADDADDFIDIECLKVTSSWDPNDKSVIPEGLTDQNHFIDSTGILEYFIRFQNTGNDTAWFVFIYDTLSPYLDITTVEPMAASHSYTFEILDAGILKFSFVFIMLPDSNVNEPESHGFVKFSVKQKSGNPAGTLIENRAGIVFDFNVPVMTNTVFNTIGDIDSVVSVAQICYTADLTSGCDSLNVNFTNTSSLPANYFRWSFGDGDSLWSANATHAYNSPGFYQVFLEGWDTTGGGMAYLGMYGMTINVFSQPFISVTSQTNVSCNGGYDGSASVTASGGTGNYSYQWNTIPVQYTPAATGMYAGTYNVLVTDEVGCYASQNITITEPAAIAISASVTNVTAPANNNGEIDITVTGGTGAYTYLWNTTDVTEDLTGLSAGTYTVTVTDANNCEAVRTDTVDLINNAFYQVPYTTHQILVYPNPNTGSFVVEITPTKYEFVRTYEVRIMNILSEMVYGKVFSDSYIRKFVTNSLFVDLDLPDGIYALRVEADGEAVGMTRIIIER